MARSVTFERLFMVLSGFGILILCKIQLFLYHQSICSSTSEITRFSYNLVNISNYNVLPPETDVAHAPDGYLVYSPHCKIPDFNPLDKSVAGFVTKINKPICSSKPPLFENWQSSTGKSKLYLNLFVVSQYTRDGEVSCCFRGIEVVADNYVFKSCVSFNGSLDVNEHDNFFAIYCKDKKNVTVYENIHSAVGKKSKKVPKSSDTKLNVLIIGFDSMSRLNLLRTMPKTVNYLKTQNFMQISGYNKIADNTLPNLMALLTGIAPGNLQKPQDKYFDDYPFIWKNFSADGYVTAYAEDSPTMSTFNNHIKGFQQQPTDHYPRSFFLVAENEFNVPNSRCQGFHTPSDHLFNYLLDFINVYKNDKFFGFFWANHFSHNDLNLPSSEDSRVAGVFERLQHMDIFNTTMVIFLSDHGLRVDRIRKTRIGWYEDRMPFLFISLPEWYKSRNHLQNSNLMQNTVKLTSPFDLHLTILEVLYGYGTSPPSGCRTCRSLFSRLPANRTCAEAGISPHWCACHDVTETVSPKRKRLAMAKLLLKSLNYRLKNDDDIDPRYGCETLRLTAVLYFREKIGTEERQFVIGIRTAPGEGEFEGTIIRRNNTYEAERSFTRINYWMADSSCANNPISKEICVCKKVFNAV